MLPPANDRPRATNAAPERSTWERLRAYLGVRTVLLFVLVVALPGGLLLLPFALASARKGSHRDPKLGASSAEVAPALPGRPIAARA